MCESSSELDQTIINFIQERQKELDFKNDLRQLIVKVSDKQADSTGQLIQLLNTIQWVERKTQLLCLVQLMKVNRQVQLFTEPASVVDSIIADSTQVDEKLGSKLIMLAILRQQKSHPSQETRDKYASFNSQIVSSQNLSIRLSGCKALIVRGDSLGFNSLISMIEEVATTKPEQADALADYFGKLITKPLSKAVCKENGFEQLNRLHEQRLFNSLYPVLIQHKSSQFGVKMMCGICSLVSLNYLQSRIIELMPVVSSALTQLPQK